MMKKIHKIDDGFHSWLVGAANYDSVLDMPKIEAPKVFKIPENLIPFSKIPYSQNKQHEIVHFYEHDIVFKDFLNNPELYIQRIYPFSGIISPDCSLYRDMPLILQMANTYINRAVGCYFQDQGITVIPNIRWGDERSYQPGLTDIPFAFLGVEKHSVVSVSTYGCIKGKDDRRYFHDGFHAMLSYLQPEIVLIHGAMPLDVFDDTYPNVQLVQFRDWTTQKRRKVM